jgi:hypothetical protein
MRLNYLLVLLILISDSCISELDLPVIVASKQLVVDGMISNQPGPYTVTLTWSSSVDADLSNAEPVAGATVQIVENDNNTFALNEVSSGVYQTTGDLTGVIGNSYKLLVETLDRKKYESVTSVMDPPGELRNVYFELKENSINQGDLTKPQDALYFYIDGESEGTNQLRWRWNATYQVHTTPEFQVKFDPGSQSYAPDPPLCSGYELIEGSYQLTGPCTCCECWVTLYDNNATISNPEITRSSHNKVYIGFLPLESIYFYQKLLIRADQISLPDEAYNFWHLVDTQQESGSNIFQPNVVKVQGNMTSVTDPSEEVFGIFSVSGISTNQLAIELEDIDKRLPLVPIDSADCRIVSGGTNEKPPFY